MTKQEREWLWQDWQDGRSIDELCDEYELTPRQVYAIIKQKLGAPTGAQRIGDNDDE
jgi:Mor family transcriptional regulator